MEEQLYNLWIKRNPYWEKRYEESVLTKFSDYGNGETSMRESRGKIYGAGYEILVIAFFLGLYHGRRRPLTEDSNKKKVLGQPIQYWGNLNVAKSSGRKPYHDLMDYIFMALVAKTDIDFIALDKGEIEANDVVRQLMTTMEEYINYGLNFIDDKLRDDPDIFFTDTAFLDLFMSPSPTSDDSELESLD